MIKSVSQLHAEKSFTEVNWYVWEDENGESVRPATPEEIETQHSDTGTLISDPVTIVISDGRTLLDNSGRVGATTSTEFALLQQHGCLGDEGYNLIPFTSRGDVDDVINALIKARDIVFPQ